jgi:hypothetical protein
MSMEVRVSERPLARYGAVVAVCILAGAVAGGISGAMASISGEGGAGVAAVVAVSTGLAMAAVLWACDRWWRGLDEAAQEAHKWAWWWGSTFGLAIGGVALFTLVFAAGDGLSGEPKDLLLGGAALVAGVQTVGYGVAWAVWWLKRQ